MKVVLTPEDVLPLIHQLIGKRYPEFSKVRVQFVMRRRLFSSVADVSIECELEHDEIPS